MRKPIGKKTRFEVFKRDSFTCAYCGGSPPETVLELDHIDPVSKGGTNDINNLVTSCFDCNRGKGATPLSSIPATLSENLSAMMEKEDQVKAYRKFANQIKKRKTKDINQVAAIYSNYFSEFQLTEYFKKNSIAMFLEKLPLHEVEEAMDKACSYINDSDKSIKYFCGICWNKAKR
jgi:hypothetical protein